jgi:hypothetical protein
MSVRIFKTLLLLISLTIGLQSFAQFTGGGRVGVNFSNLRGSSVVDNSMIVGYQIGGFVNYSLVDMLTGDLADIMSVQAELNVETKGTNAQYATLDANAATETFEAKQVFTYVSIPLLAKFTFTPSRKFSYFGEGGIFLGSLVGVTIDGEKSWNHDLDQSTDPRKYREEYSGYDFGVIIGGGASMPFGGRNTPWAAFANLRYELGLMNIGDPKDKTPDVLLPYLEDVKTSAISLTFGVSYMF